MTRRWFRPRTAKGVPGDPDQSTIDEVQRQLDRVHFRHHASGFRPYSEDEVQNYERQLGRRLPADFRWFARTYGEGWASADDPTITLADGEQRDCASLGGDLRYRDLYVEPVYPPGLVACGSTLLNDVFFLRLGKRDDGGVWYWGYYEGKDPHTELVRVAGSFTDFLSRIVVA